MQKRRKPHHHWLVISLSMFCLFLIAGGVWLFLASRSNAPVLSPSFHTQLENIDAGVIEGAPEGISKKERSPGDGLFGYRLNLTPKFSTDEKLGDLAVHNPSFNSYILVVELCLADSDDVIYRSQYIPPNHYLPVAELKTALPVGSHQAVAYLNLIDPKTMQLADILEQPLTLQVT